MHDQQLLRLIAQVSNIKVIGSNITSSKKSETEPKKPIRYGAWLQDARENQFFSLPFGQATSTTY